jgi:hypothetical protein
MVDHERTDYQPIRVTVEGQQRWAYLPHITTANNNRRRRFRRRQRNNGARVSRATSPMQWQDEHQQLTTTIPVPPTSPAKSDGMWWDDEITTTRDTSAGNNIQHNDHTPAPRLSADVIGQYLTSIRQEAESTQAPAPAPSTSRRQQFCEWAERHSNADPLTPTVSASGEETTHPPARRPLNSPPAWTAKINISPIFLPTYRRTLCYSNFSDMWRMDVLRCRRESMIGCI